MTQKLQGCYGTSISYSQLFYPTVPEKGRKTQNFEAPGDKTRVQSCSKINFWRCKNHYQIEKELIEFHRFKQLIIELIAINWQSIIRVRYFDIVDSMFESKIDLMALKTQKDDTIFL